jgi:hypothetical protein
VSDLSGSSPFKDDRPLFAFPSEKANGEYEGRPYHGPRLNLKEDDPDNAKPQLKYHAHVRQFNLDVKEDMEAYESICQAAFSQDIIVSFEERVYCEKIGSWRVLMRWAEQYCGAPKNLEKKAVVV